MSTAASHGPLQGLKVIEMGQLIAGPFCGQLLGHLVRQARTTGDGSEMLAHEVVIQKTKREHSLSCGFVLRGASGLSFCMPFGIFWQSTFVVHPLKSQRCNAPSGCAVLAGSLA